MLCFAVVLAAGCGQSPEYAWVDDQYSQLDVELTTDMEIPKDVDSISVTWAGLFGPYLRELGPAGVQLPSRVGWLGLGSSSGDTRIDPSQTADITVVAWKGAVPFTVVRAVTTIPLQSGTRILRMSLSWLCAGTAREVAPGQVESTCPAGESCRAGVCQSDDRRTEALATFDSSAQPACFDVARCLGAGSAITIDPATCTAPKGDATNFAVVKPAGTEGFCTSGSCLAPLSADPFEGWREAAGTVALPPAVCEALANGRATAVIASNACPTWSADQQFCAWAP